MFEYCADPKTLEGLQWWSCYLTTQKHFAFYKSFGIVFALLALAAPVILGMGFLGALARMSKYAPLRWIGVIYTSMVRGVPDIIFFLFVPIAMDQGFEFVRHKIKCPDITDPVWHNNEFNVCTEAKLPLGSADVWVHDTYGFLLALIAYSIVFGAFAANTIFGALNAVPKAQLETGAAFGMSPGMVFRRIQLRQMWIYALPGLSNLWMIFVKAMPLLFLLGVEDVVYWARELGTTKTAAFQYPHGDWRMGYIAVLLVFYLALTWASGLAFKALNRRMTKGQAGKRGLTA
ncbi:MAG: ABC transporter permease subunit [Pseudomonadota bacterium]